MSELILDPRDRTPDVTIARDQGLEALVDRLFNPPRPSNVVDLSARRERRHEPAPESPLAQQLRVRGPVTVEACGTVYACAPAGASYSQAAVLSVPGACSVDRIAAAGFEAQP